MPRLFTGFELPGDIAADLAGLRGGLLGARWSDPEDYHLTLRFIGLVNVAEAREIDAELRRARHDPVDVELEQIDAFGRDRPRALVVRCRSEPALLKLQKDQERRMRRLGLPPDARKFLPHVTLARLRGASEHDVARHIAGLGLFRRRRFEASEVVLFSAREPVGGPPYARVARYPLRP